MPGKPDRDALISKFMPFARSRVGFFMLKHSIPASMRDDLEQEAYVGVIVAVDQFLLGKIENLSGYLRQSIWGLLVDFICRDNTIRTPRSRAPDERIETEPIRMHPTTTDVDPALREVNAILLDACRDRVDVRILARLAGGMNRREIAADLNLSYMSVCRRVKKLGKRSDVDHH